MSGRSRFITAVLSASVLSVALAAGAAQHQAAALEGTWRVSQIKGQDVPGGIDVSMQFGADHALSGSTGCNLFSGRYIPAADALSIAPFAMTRMACTGDAARVESAFTAALEGVARAETDGPSAVILRDAAGVALLGLARTD